MTAPQLTGSQFVEAIRQHHGVTLQEAGAALRAYAEPKQLAASLSDRAEFRDKAFLAALTGTAAGDAKAPEVVEYAMRIAVAATTLRESYK